MSDRTERMLTDAAIEHRRAKVTDLCLSMASFIAEIDASSIDVASYLEQRLGPILRLPAVAMVLDQVGKDGRQLVGWKPDVCLLRV